MDYPEALRVIIRKAAEQHRGDVTAAVAAAEKAWRKAPEFAEYVDAMIRGELRSLIHDVRHQENVGVRRDLGFYGQPAKVTLGTGAVERVARNCLVAYSICGVALGQITGKQLLSFAKTEQEKADGSAFNARLCRRLSEIVPADKAVGEVLTVKKAESIMREVGGKRKKQVAA